MAMGDDDEQQETEAEQGDDKHTRRAGAATRSELGELEWLWGVCLTVAR